MVGWFTNAIKHPQVRVRDDGSPVYEYQPRLGGVGNFNQLVVDTDQLGCLLGRRGGGDTVQEGEGQWAVQPLTNPRWKSSTTAVGTHLAPVRTSGRPLPLMALCPTTDETARSGARARSHSFHPSTR